MGTPNWANETMWTGDNLPIMRGMNSESIDLIYLDPPFNSKANYAAPIGSKAAGAEFKDTWTLSDIDLAWLLDFEKNHPAITRIINATLTDSDKAYLIYMAPRLIEMQRILKPTGSIYLHCDPTMSHYLKLLMDAIFGRRNFRNEIVWKRSDAKGNVGQGTKHFARQNDYLLYYAAPEAEFRQPYVKLDEEYVNKFYRYSDPDGRRYKLDNMLGPGGAAKGNPSYEVFGVNRHWRYSESRMKKLIQEGRVVQTNPGTVPMYKRYLDESKGRPIGSNWSDISFVRGWSKERTGYPTQKPLALLDRIIKASSDEGGMILDPFCGCATACVAAHNQNRQWTGIDISEKAYHLVRDRIVNMGGLFYNLTHRTDIPKRTDLGKIPKYNCKENKQTLYGEQEGCCNGCREHFKINNLTVDHIIAKKVGGTDHLSNLQLLCGYCNSVKGSFGMEYLLWKLGSNESKPYYKPGFPHYPSDGVSVMEKQLSVNEPY